MEGVPRAIFAVVVLIVAVGCGSTHASDAERHLVYVAGESPSTASVWIADEDGAHSRRLSRGSVALLSPDGRTVAVRRRDGIYLLSSRDGHARRLTPRHLRPQAWSPDGETLIATRPALLAVLELDAIDRRSGRVRAIASGSVYGFDFSPDGHELVYSRAPVATGEGPCGDQFDLYVTKLAGGTPSRLTHDGLAAFPIWDRSRIAFSRFPGGTTIEDCSAPGIWTIDTDGSHLQPVIPRAPESLASDGLYGLQPLAWLDDEHILAGIRTGAGNQGAVLDTRSRTLRRLDEFVDEASSDSRYAVGSGGNDQVVHLAIIRLHDGRRVFLRKDACCPDWNR
jgi:hypothetical protein